MTALRKAGIVRSTRGPRGGHELTLSPSDLTLKAVVEAVDGPIEPRDTAIAGKQDAVGQRIVLREVWGDVAAAYVAALESVTFDSIVERSEQLENRAVYRI
jgi:Rrf2 family protein